MASTKISDQDLIERLTAVFQENGFEGTSLSLISEATGLEKASLYHRFPGGKDQMAQAVLESVAKIFVEDLLLPLQTTGALDERVKECGRRLQQFYGGGKRSCLLDTLSLPGGSSALHASVEATYKIWMDAFAAVAKEAGYSSAQARLRAEDAIMGIHGALVLARATGQMKPFVRMIARLPDLLVN
jgi:TetR/AcrR family transcriptional regulator, lmrAB and yxaGH operons repressor